MQRMAGARACSAGDRSLRSGSNVAMRESDRTGERQLRSFIEATAFAVTTKPADPLQIVPDRSRVEMAGPPESSDFVLTTIATHAPIRHHLLYAGTGQTVLSGACARPYLL